MRFISHVCTLHVKILLFEGDLAPRKVHGAFESGLSLLSQEFRKTRFEENLWAGLCHLRGHASRYKLQLAQPSPFSTRSLSANGRLCPIVLIAAKLSSGKALVRDPNGMAMGRTRTHAHACLAVV